MKPLLNIAGWTCRVSAAICITYILVSVVRGAEGFTTVAGILGSVAFHAGFALAGTQLVGLARRATLPLPAVSSRRGSAADRRA